MNGFGFGGWFGLIFNLIFWILIIVAIAYLVKYIARQTGKNPALSEEDSLKILKARFAKGEIDEKQYEQKKKLLNK
ncbi:MAG: hypothetical protein GF347_01655 [Candidatus Moranbacteria bacterium]|nr:hypothetical protein [Candidatus Moranbacteria bacterium]